MDGSVALGVRDQGDGLPSATFERFRSGPGSTGHGLGLAIMWAVAEAHRGRAAVGPGSAVTVTLPSRLPR